MPSIRLLWSAPALLHKAANRQASTVAVINLICFLLSASALLSSALATLRFAIAFRAPPCFSFVCSTSQCSASAIQIKSRLSMPLLNLSMLCHCSSGLCYAIPLRTSAKPYLRKRSPAILFLCSVPHTKLYHAFAEPNSSAQCPRWASPDDATKAAANPITAMPSPTLSPHCFASPLLLRAIHCHRRPMRFLCFTEPTELYRCRSSRFLAIAFKATQCYPMPSLSRQYSTMPSQSSLCNPIPFLCRPPRRYTTPQHSWLDHAYAMPSQRDAELSLSLSTRTRSGPIRHSATGQAP